MLPISLWQELGNLQAFLAKHPLGASVVSPTEALAVGGGSSASK